jgi:hypothetical protein
VSGYLRTVGQISDRLLVAGCLPAG